MGRQYFTHNKVISGVDQFVLPREKFNSDDLARSPIIPHKKQIRFMKTFFFLVILGQGLKLMDGLDFQGVLEVFSGQNQLKISFKVETT